MVEKQEILDAIVQVTRELGGPPGRMTFENQTGIRRHEWYGRYWPNWGEALKEAGFAPNSRTEGLGIEELLDIFLEEVKRLQRIPTDGEMRIRSRENPRLPRMDTFRLRLGRKNELLKKLLAFARHRNESPNICRVIEEAITPDHEAQPSPSAPDLADGFVYLIRSGKNFKIGRTNSPDRRQFEIGLQLPEKLEPVHSIRTDDPSGIEAFWHNRFKTKRLNGEWFRLSAEDIRAFKRRKFM